MTFQTFIETKYPLYSDPQMKVNLTVQQVCELVEEWENSKVRKTFKERLNEELQKQCPLCGSDVLYTTSKQKYCKCGWEN